jgi:hypothetical protein
VTGLVLSLNLGNALGPGWSSEERTSTLMRSNVEIEINSGTFSFYHKLLSKKLLIKLLREIGHYAVHVDESALAFVYEDCVNFSNAS